MARRTGNTGNQVGGAQPAPVAPMSKSDQEIAESYASTQKNILELQQKIKTLSSMTFQSEKARAEQQKRILEYTELMNEGLENNKKIEEDILEDLKKQDKIENNIVKLVKSRYENTKETQDLTKKITKDLRNQKIEFEGISDAGKAVTQNMKVSTTFGNTFQSIAFDVKDALERGINLSEEFMDTLQETEQIRGEYRNLEMELAQNAEKAAKGQYDAQSVSLDLAKKSTKLKQDQAALDQKEADFLKDRASMEDWQIEAMEEEIRLEKDMLNARNLALEGMREQHKVLEETSKTAEKTLGVLEKVTSGDFKGALLQKFGLDDINKQLKEKVGGALVNVIDSVKKGDLKGAFAAAGGGLKDLTKLAGAFTLALGIGAIFKLGSFLLDTFMKADAEVAELGKNFGISKDEAKELHHTSVDVANEMGVVGVHAEQIAKGLKTVSDNLGGIDLTGKFSEGNAAVQQMVKDTTLLTEKFGLSGEEAGNMSNIAAIAGKSVGEMSMMSSKLGNGIFSAKESMKILAGIPKSIVSQMAKMPEAMIKTAMHAKMLGMNMKQIADIGRKSLDIEQSLEAEMEARALIGKDINLDAMRAAALNGDQETVMNELLKTAGSMEDFNNMNVLQKEALAKAAGMEVDQMAEMLGKQEELNKAGITQAKLKELQKMNEQDLAKEIANTSDKEKKAYLEKLQAEKKSESTQAAMASLMQRLQEMAVKLVTPLMDMVDAFLNGQDGADAMGGLIDGIGGAIKAIVPYIKAIASVIGFLLKPLGWIGSMFKSTEDATHGVAEGAKGVATAIKPVESGFGTILKAAVGIGAIFAGKKLLGGVGKVVGKVLGAPGRLLGFGGKKGGDAAGGEDPTGKAGGAAKEAAKGKNIVSTILDKIKSIIDSLKGVVQSGIKFVKDVGKDLIKTLAELIKEVGNLLNQILDLVKNVGSNLISTISKLVSEFGNLLTTLLDVIGNVGTKLISVVGDLLNGIVNLLNSVGSNLLSTLNKLLQGIGTILNSAVEIVVNVGTKLAEGAVKILNIIMRGLASAAATLPGIMASLGAAVVAFFTPMAALVNPLVIAGIAIFVAALIGMGYAFKLLGEGIGAAAPGITAFFDGVGGVIEKVGEAIAKVIETITTSIIRLQDIDGKKMLGAALGIYAIAGALAAFGGGSAIAGLGSALGKLFDEDPVDKFNRFAAINAAGLLAVATAINTLGKAMKTFSDVSGGLNLDKVDAMIQKIEDLKAAQASAAISDLATTAVGGVTSFVSKLFGSSEEQKTQTVGTGAGGGSAAAAGGGGNPMANVEKKLDTLIGLFSQAANQPTVIKFGEKVVEEIKGQIDFKKAYQVKVDNTYGRTT